MDRPLGGLGLGFGSGASRCLVVFAGGIALGCSSGGSHVETPASASPEPASSMCRTDETREVYCDELLPLTSSLPAPPPFDSCPGAIESPSGNFEVKPAVAAFDQRYTAYIRKRTDPGHACCYSWCTPVTVRPISAVPPNGGCNDPRAFRESFCMTQPEAGSSDGARSPFDHCPAAIVPPRGKSFWVPPAAALDSAMSWQHRQQGLYECCYGWCSIAPAGSGLERR